MTAVVTLRTERLLLRPWRDSDRAPFAAMNADRRVMERFPATNTRAESNAGFDRIVAKMLAQAFGLWAVEVPGIAEVVGFIGLNPADAVLPTRSSPSRPARTPHADHRRSLAPRGSPTSSAGCRQGRESICRRQAL
jgi:RimJ/RimL family protein N-acetyltransferase